MIDNQFTISASVDHQLKIWYTQSGKLKSTLIGHLDEITSVALSPDKKLVISGSKDCTIKIWNLESAECLNTLQKDSNGKSGIIAIAVVPAKCPIIISVTQDRMLRAWDLLEEEFLWEDNLGHKFSDSICDMSYKSLYELDDPIIITATQDDCHIILGFRIYNEQSKKDILQFVSLSRHLEDCEWNLLTDDNDDFIKSILVSEDAEIAISATFGGELRILDLTNSEIAHLLKRERVINALALDKNNSRIVLAVSTMFNEGIIKICSLADPNREIIINNLHTKTINSIKITSDGKWLISVSDDQTLVVSDLNKECEFIARFIAESPLLTCDITPDGNTIIAGDKLGNLHFLRIKGN